MMKSILVKEAMVPLQDYATVSENATLYEAVWALEKAQAEFDQSRYRHRAILVYNDQNKIVGKVSQLDLIRALEPRYDQVLDVGALSRTGYSMDYIQTLSHAEFWTKPLNDLCRKAADNLVKNFMHKPSEGEFIDEGAELNVAVHRLIVGCHQSLLVTRKGEIVGVLRLTDVFKLICENVKACKLE
jgi:CBS-domain-containing membrane protein